VAAFSTRAREGAPVSTLIDWDELGADMEPFTIVTVPRRLARLRRDPWIGYWTSRQRIPRAAFSAVVSET
jgi:bifunctional non-homologous end joining protein LigD